MNVGWYLPGFMNWLVDLWLGEPKTAAHYVDNKVILFLMLWHPYKDILLNC